MIKIKQM